MKRTELEATEYLLPAGARQGEQSVENGVSPGVTTETPPHPLLSSHLNDIYFGLLQDVGRYTSKLCETVLTFHNDLPI